MQLVINGLVLLFLAHLANSAVITVEMSPLGGCGPPKYGDSCLIAYVTNITIGTPALHATWVIDGGIDASRNWAWNCTTRACKSHTLYNPAQSSTFQQNGTQYSVDYFAGLFQATGTIAKDVIKFGDLESTPPATQFVMMETFAPVIYVSMFDFVAGPFGLAYPSPGQEQLQLVNSLYNLGVLDEPVFSLWAPANNTITSPGKLTIGGTDPSLYYGLIVWVSIIPTPQRGYEFLWLSVLDDFLINGVSTGACTSGQCTFFTDPAIGYMDIGTTAPAHVNSDCSNISELPFYTFIIGGVAFDFSPEDYVIQTDSGCYTSLKGGHDDSRPFEFGFPWFKTYYSVFDIVCGTCGRGGSSQVIFDLTGCLVRITSGTLVGGQGCSLFEVLLGGASSDHDIVISGGVYE